MNNDSFLAFKRSLCDRNEWLSPFLIAAEPAAVGRSRILSGANDDIPFEPLLFENLLVEISAALDRALATSQEADRLDLAATKAAADYELFRRNSSHSRQLERLALRRSRLEADRDLFLRSSEAFGARKEPGLEKGHAVRDGGLAKAIEKELESVDVGEAAIEARWNEISKYEAAYHSRHTSPGNSHNFSERREKLEVLLQDDLDEAYQKAWAVYRGLHMVYGANIAHLDEPPSPGPDGRVLHALVLWTRGVMRSLEIAAQKEVTYDLTIPLVQPWRDNDVPLVSEKDFKAALETRAPMSFSLDSVFFNQKNIRLRSVGLAIGPEPPLVQRPDNRVDDLGFWRIRATIHTPAQRSLSGSYRRPPVVLGAVSALGRSIPIALSSGPECRNVCPIGEWRIAVDAQKPVWADESQKSAQRFMQDLKLHLVVTATPEASADSVFW